MTTLNLKQIVIDYRMNYKTQMLIKAALCNYCVNLTQSHIKLCVYRKILCVTWRTVFLFCAFWLTFCASNTLWRRLTETLAVSQTICQCRQWVNGRVINTLKCHSSHTLVCHYFLDCKTFLTRARSIIRVVQIYLFTSLLLSLLSAP